MKKLIFIFCFVLIVSIAYAFNIVDKVNQVFHINQNYTIEPNSHVVVMINDKIILDDITPNTTTYNLSISMLGNKREE